MANKERSSVAEQNYKLFDSLRKRFGGAKVSDTIATPPTDHRQRTQSLSRLPKKLSAPPLVSLIDSSDKIQQTLYSSPTRSRVHGAGGSSTAAPPLATVRKISQPARLQPQAKTSPPQQRTIRRCCGSTDDILETSSVASSSSSQDHAYFSSKTSTGSLTPPEEEPTKVQRPKIRQSMTEDIDEGYEEKEIDKQVKSWDRHIGRWMFDGVKPGYSPQTERALRLSPEVRVPVPEDVYEMAQNSPKSESWRRSLNKYALGKFVSEESGKKVVTTQEEPVFPVFDDNDDDVRTKVSKLRRSKSFHSKHTVTIPPHPAPASSTPMKTSADSPANSPLAKVQAKPHPNSAAIIPIRNALGSPIKSTTPFKAQTSTTTPLQNAATSTSSPVRSATPTKSSEDQVTTPTPSGDTTSNLVNKPQTNRPLPTTGNVSSVTPPVVGNLVQEKAKLFGPTAHVKRSQSLSVRDYQRPVKYLQRNDKFVPTANNSPPVISPTAKKNTTSRQVLQNTVTTNSPVSEMTENISVDQSTVKDSPVDIPWQAAIINSKGIPWQARAAGNITK